MLIAVVAFAACSAKPEAEAPAASSATTEVTPQPAAPAVTQPPAAPAPGQLSKSSFLSEALGVEKSYYVYLPAGYETSGKRYPTLYYLHGMTGNESNWSKGLGLVEAADKMGLQAVVIMPDGDDGFYVNWATEVDYDACVAGKRPFGAEDDMKHYCVKTARYEDYITRDLISHVDKTYRTIAKRSARGIGGLSMGGYGALTLAMRHPELFASTASHSGVASLLYIGPFPYETGKAQLLQDVATMIGSVGPFGIHLSKIYGMDLERWRERDPATLAAALQDGALAIYIDCGTEDEFRLQNGASHLHDVLEASGVSHEFTLLPGKHDAAFWRDRIDDSLKFHMRHLR